MKILIIGSKGFIGGHLLKHLDSKSIYKVWGCDVVSDDSLENYFLVDVTNSNFYQIFESQKFDVCINCSGAASVPDSIKNPIRDFQLNTVQAFKILEAIRSNQKDCKFINLSSAAVYGNPRSLPISENHEIKPLSPYGFHKMNTEQIMLEFYKFYNIPTCSLRIFSAYGEGLQKQLFWDLYKKAKLGKQFSLYGTGNESRDFIHIEDLVILIEIIFNNSHFKADIVNGANGKEIFIKDAVKTFYDFFKENIEYSFSGEERKGDPSNWVANISRIKEMGYKPKIDINFGLEKYYNWTEKL